MENSAKVLLLGKTGVGKSSFINYFIGKDVAEAGGGKPITQELTAYEVNDGKYPLEIFDSKGLEAMEASEQKEELIDLIARRNNGKNVLNWFHTIFYCTSVEKRFEDFEARFIKELQGEISQHVHIILTKCDSVKPGVIQEMKKTIREKLGSSKVDIFEVVSVNQKFRDGTEAVQRGKEVLSEQVFRLLWEDIADKLSTDYARSLHRKLIVIADNTLEDAEKLVDKTVSLKTLIEFVKDENAVDERLEELASEMDERMDTAIEDSNREFDEILKPAAKLYSSYKGIVTDTFAGKAFLELEDWDFYDWISHRIDLFDDDQELFKMAFPNMVKAGLIQDGDFTDEELTFGMFLKAIASGFGDLLTLKGRLKKLCKSIYQEFIYSLPSEEQIKEETYRRIIDYVKM